MEKITGPEEQPGGLTSDYPPVRVTTMLVCKS